MNLSFLNDLDIKITPRALLKDFTTFRLGGPCTAMIECARSGMLTETIRRLRQNGIDFILMGFGSNILASDQGIDRIIIRYSSNTPHIHRQGCQLTAEASTHLDDLVLFSIQEGLEGLVPFSGIPGTIGGAVAGNAGAYGIDISKALTEVTLLKLDNSVMTVSRDALLFSYRDSSLKHSPDIILSAVFTVTPGRNTIDLKKAHDHIVATRQEKHGNWRTTPSAGSFFRNILPSSRAARHESAGCIIEQAGGKKIHVGKAHCFEKHANILTCDNGGSAQDVYGLAQAISSAVKEQFNIELAREVRLLGKFPYADHENKQKGFW